MFDSITDAALRGLVFDYLGLVIAVLTLVQIVWGLFARE
jgi:hypothetical protein